MSMRRIPLLEEMIEVSGVSARSLHAGFAGSATLAPNELSETIVWLG